MKTINVGLIGFGNIGTGVVKALSENGELIQKRTGALPRVTAIADVDTKRQRDAEYDPAILTDNADALLSDPSIQIVIELVGGLEPARTFVEKALRNGKHVVTANKAMLAVFGAELWRLAAEHGVGLFFEASVGGGIPIIRSLQLGLSANKFRSVYGILNGTCNYILSKMSEKKLAFESVLTEAQAQGFAEPDPTYDIEGYDTAHKIAVLASLAFEQDVRFSDVFVEGITRLRQIDFEYARELGYTIKLLGIAKADDENGRIEARVHPTLLPRNSLLANVNGVFNGIMVEGDLTGPVMFYGRGAGPRATASAVLSDVMSAATFAAQGIPLNDHRLKVRTGDKRMKPIAELQTSYYIRIPVMDKPGVMAKLSGELAVQGISIDSMIQKGDHPAGKAEVIIVTHIASESSVQAALKDIAGFDITIAAPFVLRVEQNL